MLRISLRPLTRHFHSKVFKVLSKGFALYLFSFEGFAFHHPLLRMDHARFSGRWTQTASPFQNQPPPFSATGLSRRLCRSAKVCAYMVSAFGRYFGCPFLLIIFFNSCTRVVRKGFLMFSLLQFVFEYNPIPSEFNPME